MPSPSASTDPPRDARAGARRRGRVRRVVRQVVMTTILFLLVGIIAGYWWITDPARVRAMAEKYLSEIIGGQVTVNKATLSIFEGLRLEGIVVNVDEQQLADSTIFKARMFWVKPNLTALLSGRLEATKILAVDPQVLLCECVDKRQWNYQRLTRKPRPASKSEGPVALPALPEMLLRAGLVQYSRIRSGRYELLGRLAIDGQLAPQPDNRYKFVFNSRAPGEATGPRLQGELNLERLAVSAKLDNLEFSRALRSMLPSQVQDWWVEHQLSGRIRIPSFEYIPGPRGQRDQFRVEVQFDDVRFCILPEEVLGPEYAAIKARRPGIRLELPDMGTVSRSALIDEVLQPLPIMLKKVSGRCTFTSQRVAFSGMRGMVENSWVSLDGAVEGYRPTAPVSAKVSAWDLVVPERPRYILSLPHDVRKIYGDFRPSGRLSLAFEFDRAQEGGKLKARGDAFVHDAKFCFNDFPYPLRLDGGQVTFGPDPLTPSYDRVTLKNIRGFGLPNTPNEHNAIVVNGWISPIERGSEVRIDVAGDRIVLDPNLRSALPREGREAVAMFDVNRTPEGVIVDKSKPVVPVQVEGGFAARIFRALGPRQRVEVEVDLDIQRGNGAFYGFPYPLRDVSGQVLVRPSHTQVKNMLIRKGRDAWLTVDGFVRYGKNRPVAPDLTVVARNVPIDDDFRLAMPVQQQQWLAKAGIDGRMDVDGKIYLPKGETQTDFDLAIALKQGTIWPVLGTHAVTAAAAKLHVNRTQLQIQSLTGNRGGGKLTGGGEISWPEDKPRFSVTANVADAPLDPVMYQIIGASGRKAWDALRPAGTADLSIHYSGGMEEEAAAEASKAASAGQTPPATNPAAPPGRGPGPGPVGQPTYTVTITPKSLALNPVSFPWPMDRISGSATVTPEKIALKDIVARHGEATLRLSGSGASQPQAAWDLSVAGESITPDANFVQALPEGLKYLFDGTKLQGKLSFNCQDLAYRAPAGAPTDLHFTSTVNLAGGSLAFGMPITGVNGTSTLAIELRDGQIENLRGTIDIPTITFAGRPMTRLSSYIVKRPGTNIYQFTKIAGDLSGGKMSGQVDLTLPTDGPASYALSVTLLDVNVGDVVGDAKVKGRLSGRLDLAQSVWSDPSTRVGTGSVQVQGRELYHVPVMFGWLEVLNMALPVKKPFNEATTAYILRGQKLVIEDVTLRTDVIVMKGSGALDFDTGKFHLVFLTDNANKFKIPIIGDFIDVAKNEMLQIYVSGTVDKPQVQARSMNTLSTTIDQISKPPKDKPKTAKRQAEAKAN